MKELVQKEKLGLKLGGGPWYEGNRPAQLFISDAEGEFTWYLTQGRGLGILSLTKAIASWEGAEGIEPGSFDFLAEGFPRVVTGGNFLPIEYITFPRIPCFGIEDKHNSQWSIHCHSKPKSI